jgi:hypothetical protein
MLGTFSRTVFRYPATMFVIPGAAKDFMLQKQDSLLLEILCCTQDDGEKSGACL